MAAYAATVTSLMKRAVKIDQVVGIGLFAGSVNITNYNSTLVAIADIQKKFKSIIAVLAAMTDSGFLLEYVIASNAFKARLVPAHAHDFVVQFGGAIGTNMEVGLSANTDAATFEGGTGITAVRTLSSTSPVASQAAAALAEVANDVDVGAANFVAIGLI